MGSCSFGRWTVLFWHSGPRMPIFDNLGISREIFLIECWVRARWKRISELNIVKSKKSKFSKILGTGAQKPNLGITYSAPRLANMGINPYIGLK